MSGATTREAQAPISARPCILLGLAVLVISFGGLGAWAAMAPIASAVVAPGVVMVNGSRKRVQHPQGGTVARIHVRDGDIVTRGQVLLDMDATQARASLGIVRARLLAARALKARLQAERDGSDVSNAEVAACVATLRRHGATIASSARPRREIHTIAKGPAATMLIWPVTLTPP